MPKVNTISDITETIVQRSHQTRQDYLAMVEVARQQEPVKGRLSCSNWAHAVAAEDDAEKQSLPAGEVANLGIVTAYNDMLSAHQPFATYPNIIKLAARSLGANAQVAGGVPAMCDGVTQGQPGMELSLLSRDVIAMATAVSLSHDVYDGVICLGVCDKIVPGMLIGALQFGHLPLMFVPAGPMPSGISNKEKATMRQKYALGEITKQELQEAESASYHSAGTCTFYGTANTNQVLMEVLGVQLAGTSFINPNTELRTALTKASVIKLLEQTKSGKSYRPVCDVVTEQSLVNAMVMLMATGGSTNLLLHLVAIARAAGVLINGQDMDAISRITPLLARVYPNGQADVNHFEQAGGLAFVVNELRNNNLLNENVVTVMGEGLDAYTRKPELDSNKSVAWSSPVNKAGDETILASFEQPFSDEGGVRFMTGNLGAGVVKISSVNKQHRVVEAPCKVFESQNAFQQAFENGELEKDHVSVVRFQGPSANGMPELHKLTPYLSALQDKGYNVALVTDGRMSGASGKVLAAIHMMPEAKNGGLLAYLNDGDIVRVDANNGEVAVLEDESVLRQREAAQQPPEDATVGRGLFASMRNIISASDSGASILFD